MKVSNTQERLKEMMELFDLKQADIVKRTGINKSSLSNYISGKRIPTQEQISIIADPYGINPAWLMGYDVDISVLPKRTEQENMEELRKQLMQNVDYYNMTSMLTPEENLELTSIVIKLLRLSQGERHLVLNLLKSVVSELSNPNLPKDTTV